MSKCNENYSLMSASIQLDCNSLLEDSFSLHFLTLFWPVMFFDNPVQKNSKSVRLDFIFLIFDSVHLLIGLSLGQFLRS